VTKLDLLKSHGAFDVEHLPGVQDVTEAAATEATAEAIEKQWGVLVTEKLRKNHLEVKESLNQIEVESFVPLIENETVVRGHLVRRVTPLFGRYVFFEITGVWRAVSTAKGVKGLMLTRPRKYDGSFGPEGAEYEEEQYPAIVDPAQMQAMQQFCCGEMYQKPIRHPDDLIYGQRVTTTSGPFAYHVGRYDGPMPRRRGKRGKQRREAAVFDFFGREQRVVFAVGSLIAA
jgi:transcription antitermination factor NusG